MIVFDKDGTLVDLDARWSRYFDDYIQRVTSASGDVSLGARLRSLLGVAEGSLVADGPAAVETEAQIRQRVVDELMHRGHSRPAATHFVAAADEADDFGPLTPIGDLRSAPEKLSSAGFLLAIATSDDRENTVAELEELGIASLFCGLRCGDDDGPVKPDGAVLLGLAAEFDLLPSAVLFVGDSKQDMATARAAGAAFAIRCAPSAVPAWADPADQRLADIGELVI